MYLKNNPICHNWTLLPSEEVAGLAHHTQALIVKSMTQVTMNSAHALAWLDCLNDVPLFEDRQSSNVLPRKMAAVRVHNSPNKPSEGGAWLNMSVLNII